MPLADELKSNWNAWVQGGVLCSEMEAATLFVVSSVLGKRAGGIMLALNQAPDTLNTLCGTAVEGMRRVIQMDRATAA